MSGIIYGTRFGVAVRVSRKRRVDQKMFGVGIQASLKITVLRAPFLVPLPLTINDGEA